MRVAIIGTGRMGKALQEVLRAKGHSVVAAVGRPEPSFWESPSVEGVIDFSHASQTETVVKACISRGLPLVTGTTGWQSQEESLRTWATSQSQARWIWGSNFSRGILLLKMALKAIAAQWPSFSDWEAILVDIHHRHKKDAPSGTARELQSLFPFIQAIHSLRVGEVIGEHLLLLSGPSEEIELRHRAHSRVIFAEGAVWALEWLVTQKHFVGRFDEIHL
ncbi:MAG: 4-hydroxy-tetrahydrodipicolinate reductase [Bacteroidia bacterium]|nr:MAG: 4-hydroxy-tetrahydrodipicolinate reductase [Bacteroidia bacterium]